MNTSRAVAEWVRKYKKGGIDLDPNAEVVDKDAKIRQLEKQLADMTMERDFLKKVSAYFVKDQK